MNKAKLLIFFLILSVFLIKPAYAQDGYFSGFPDIFGQFRNLLGPTPDNLVYFLKNFGLPEEILVDWGGIIFYIIIPVLTFALVLKAVMVDEIIVGMMKYRTFKGWKGWVFVLLIVLFLFPTGVVGMFAMWLYAAAGIFVVYGFGALLIVNIVKRFIPHGSPKVIFGVITGVLICIFLTFFVHFLFAFIIGILAIFFVVRGEWQIAKLAETKYPYKKSRDLGDRIYNEGMGYLGGVAEQLTNTQLNASVNELNKIVNDLTFGVISPDQAIKKFEEWKKNIESAIKKQK